MTVYAFTIPGEPFNPDAPIIDLTPEVIAEVAANIGVDPAEHLADIGLAIEQGWLTPVARLP